jgi:uncharacterized protein YneF (UPF0154 family)
MNYKVLGVDILQLFLLLFGLAVGVFIMYYLPIIAKDLHKSTKQNEVIIKLLEKQIVKDEEK